MKSWIGKIALALLFGGFYVFNGGPAPEPLLQGSASLDAALNQAAASGKPIFVEIGAAWCSVCTKLEATTLRDPAVLTTLSQFEVVQIDVDEQPEIAARFDTGMLPTLAVLDEAGNIQRATVGFHDVTAFQHFLLDERVEAAHSSN